MKNIIALFFFINSFIGISQYPDSAELEKIIKEISIPIKNGAIDQVISRIIFPIKVGTIDYTVKSFRSSFSQIFIDGYSECLSDPENYQVALPGDDNWYLAVCMVAPDGYEATVFSFVKIKGVWKLKSIDFQ
jgi:hypothetical protein